MKCAPSRVTSPVPSLAASAAACLHEQGQGGGDRFVYIPSLTAIIVSTFKLESTSGKSPHFLTPWCRDEVMGAMHQQHREATFTFEKGGGSGGGGWNRDGIHQQHQEARCTRSNGGAWSARGPPPPSLTRPDAACLQVRHTVVPAGIEMALLAVRVLPAIHFGGGGVVRNEDFADL